MGKREETTVIGGGCFWCTEAAFQEIKGVEKIEVGYAGGHVENPTYREVVSGDTGHIEVAKITYNPEEISFSTLIDIFWTIHDPTSLDKQGADVGIQYRSVIFYLNQEQKAEAEESLKKAEKNLYDKPIVTEIKPLDNFYPGEIYHQKYYTNNPNAGYCRVVIDPKVKKLRKQFTEYLKN